MDVFIRCAFSMMSDEKREKVERQADAILEPIRSASCEQELQEFRMAFVIASASFEKAIDEAEKRFQ